MILVVLLVVVLYSSRRRNNNHNENGSWCALSKSWSQVWRCIPRTCPMTALSSDFLKVSFGQCSHKIVKMPTHLKSVPTFMRPVSRYFR